MKTIVFIDGENFKNAAYSALRKEGIDNENIDFTEMNFRSLLDKALHPDKIKEIRYYAAKIRKYKETEEKSEELIQQQRSLISNLHKQNIKFIQAGQVRMHETRVNNETVQLFSEKGVDVRMAVDLVNMAADKKLDRAVILSSDSDLQPAISALKKRNVETVYMGFKIKPNRGLVYSTDKNILLTGEDLSHALRTV